MATSQVTDLNSLLVSKPGYRNGWPCLRGTGIPVHTLAARYMGGLTAEQLREEYPFLDPSLVYAALAYYLANKELVELQLDEEEAETRKLASVLQQTYPDRVTIVRIED